jgi:hypothetical protein
LTPRQRGRNHAGVGMRFLISRRSSRRPYHRADGADVMFAAIIAAALIGLVLLAVL